MQPDPLVHLHELRCSGCGLELGSLHRREAADRAVIAFFYPPGGGPAGEAATVACLQAIQRGEAVACPACGGAIHEGCLTADLRALTSRRGRKGRPGRPPGRERDRS